ncbi:MAG: hypothetical protein AAGH92_04915, partial [Planctomycetota bacterium]
LIAEIWGRHTIERSTLRRVVYNLRSSLRDFGLDDLAKMIDGSHPHHYGLISLNDRRGKDQPKFN